MRVAKTSRAKIVDCAYELAHKEGLRAVTVRRVARELNLAPGSILNYLPSKADLVSALVARYFKEALYKDFCQPEAGEGFVDYVERLQLALGVTLTEFRELWLPDVQALPEKDKRKVLELQRKLFDHMVSGLKVLYKRDAHILPDLPEELSADRICSYVVHELVSDAVPDVQASMLALLRRSLYGTQTL